MTSDDPDALWAWVNAPGGRDDIGAGSACSPRSSSATRAAASAPRGSASCAARWPDARASPLAAAPL